MSQIITLSKSNIVDSTNTVLRHNFPQSVAFDEDMEIGLSQVSMYNSIYNINGALYNNNTFSYYWFSNSGTGQVSTTPIKVTIPDGYYTTSDLNEFLMSVMVSRKHYTQSKTDSSKRTFYISFKDNVVNYKVQLYLTPCPTTADLSNNGLVLPIGTTWSNVGVQTSKTPSVLFPTTSNFNKIVGFSQGTFPAINSKNTAYTVLGDTIPTQSPCSNIIMRCNLVKNMYTAPDDILHSFQFTDSTFGQLNQDRPNEIAFVSVRKGAYNFIEIRMTDQDFQPIQILDPQMLITLLLRKR